MKLHGNYTKQPKSIIAAELRKGSIIMPSVSKKQRAKMAILHKEGKITDAEWEKFKKIVPKKKKK